MIAVATHDQASGEIAVFAVNRSLTEPLELSVDLRLVDGLTLTEHLCIFDDDPFATNSITDPDRVAPRPGTSTLQGSALTVQLPPISWHCIRLTEGNTA